MSEKNTTPAPTNTNPAPAPAAQTEEPKNPEPVKVGLFQKAWMWLNAPAREAFHPVKYHQEEAAVHVLEAEKLQKVNPQDHPTIGSFLRGAGKAVARIGVVGLSIIGAMSLVSHDSNNNEDTPVIESSNDDIIE